METIYHLVGACGEHGLTHPTVWMATIAIGALYVAFNALSTQEEPNG